MLGELCCQLVSCAHVSDRVMIIMRDFNNAFIYSHGLHYAVVLYSFYAKLFSLLTQLDCLWIYVA